MGYSALPTITENLHTLQNLLTNTPPSSKRQRLHLLLLIKSQQVTSRAAAARHLACHRNTIATWLERYRSGGLDKLLIDKPLGRPPGQRLLEPHVLQALQERLNTAKGFASYVAIQDWLFERYGLKIAYKSLHKLVRYRLQAKLKQPQPSHPQKR